MAPTERVRGGGGDIGQHGPMTARTVVFVHGNPETTAIWGPLADALDARSVERIVRLAPPGFGAPVPAGFASTMDSYAEWLVAELAVLHGDGHELDVVGHDWGAGHVFGALARRPELFRTWACDIAGVLHRDYVWHDMAQLWQTPEVGEQTVAALTSGTVEGRTPILESLGLTQAMAVDIATAANDDMARSILALYRSAVQPAVGDLGDRLAALQLPPGLVIDAVEDPYVPSALGNEIAARLGAEVLRLDGRGHWWMVADVDEIADELTAFWSAH